MRLDCDLFCLLTERRRGEATFYDSGKRSYSGVMRGFDTEDLDVIRKAVISGGIMIRQCAPGPPMDDIEEEQSEAETEDDEQHMTNRPGCSATIVSSRPKSKNQVSDHGKMLFHRQRMPGTAVITQERGGGQRRYSTVARRSIASRSRRFAISNKSAAAVAAAAAAEAESSRDDELDRLHDLKEGSPLNLESGIIPQIDRAMSIPYLCCKMWRWKDLQVDAALHRLEPMPWCRFGRVTINNATVSCCNPYHYGLWIRPDLHSSRSSTSVGAELQPQEQGPYQLANGGAGNIVASSTVPAFRHGFHHPNIPPLNADEMKSSDPALAMGHVRGTFQRSVTTPVLTSTRSGRSATFLTPFQAAESTARVSVYDPGDEPPSAAPPPVPPPPLPLTGPPRLDLHSNILANNIGPSTARGLIVADVAGHTTTTSSNIVGYEPESIHANAMVWGRMIRWEQNDRIGDVVNLYGQFAVIGKLSETVLDAQDVRIGWDIENNASFALIKQFEKDRDEIWLYNSSDEPLFFLTSSRSLTNEAKSESQNIRRLSPGYCISVHKTIDSSPSAAIMANTTNVVGGATSDADLITATNQQQNKRSGTVGRRGGVGGKQLSQISFLTVSIGTGWGLHYDGLPIQELNCRYEVVFT